jgi:hypothetical protein
MKSPEEVQSQDDIKNQPRSRRALLWAMLGGAGAAVAATVARAAPVQADTGDAALVGLGNTGGSPTRFTNDGSLSADKDGLGGISLAGGTGVKGQGKFGTLGISSTSGGFGAWGQHTGSGNGVNGDSVTGAGVHGKSTSGYGGVFEGGKAQVRLVPKSTSGRPTTGSHARGELYLGSTGTLFICVASGTPGTWRKVTTTSA